MKANVKPDRRVECPVLVQAKPREFVVKNLTILFGEVPILDAPVGNRAGHAMDELANGSLPFGCALFPVKIF